jgi:sucrose-phosphate synthase
MARNEWINGYLEAILDVGSGVMKKRSDGRLKIAKFQQVKEDKLFSPIKYFVEEVINSFDESDLHRTWVKVSSHSLFFFFRSS